MRNRSKRCRQSGGLAAGACLALLGAFALPAGAQTTDGSGLPSSSQYTPATPASTGYDAPYRLAPADACAGGTYGGSGAGAIITDLTARLAYRARGGALYSQSECTANAIELESGSTGAEGNVLICHENRFGPVCDDFWTDSAAGVVCRQLGYATGFREQLSFFGALSSTDYWLDDVQCTGTEANLSACRHEAWGDHNCFEGEAAAVSCTTVLTGLHATGGGRQMRLAWDRPPNDGGITGHEYRYKTTGDYPSAWTAVPNSAANESNAREYTVSGLDSGTEYAFQVRVVGGVIASDPGEATATTNGLTNDAPEITTTSPVEVEENTTGVATLAAIDRDSDDSITWTPAGGADAAQFNLTPAGVLTFAAAPDYENPTDVASTTPANAAANNEYLVIVRASDGTANTDLTLVVQVTDASEQPAKPARPTVSPTAGETTSLDVSWTVPDLNGDPDIIGYDVQYRQGDDGAWTDWPHGGTGTSTAVTGLTANTGYQVRVRAKNGELDSDWSDPSHLSGTSPPPPTPNSAPTFSGGARTRSVPENSEAGTAVGNPVTATDADGDTLTYTLAGEDAASFELGAATGQIGTRSGVSYNHEAQPSHSVTVMASDGAASAAVAVKISVTDLDEQPATPARPAASPTAGETTSLDVSWTAPDLNGGPDITGYELQYRQGDGGAWTDWTHGGAATSTRITGLTADTDYQVRVRALNGETPSDWSEPASAVTATAAPALPGLGLAVAALLLSALAAGLLRRRRPALDAL